MSIFRRITTGGSWIPQIDGLRFAAIFSVLLLHSLIHVRAQGSHPLVFPVWSHWLTFAVENGDRGVLLFFVISGYILARPFLREYRLEGKKVGLGAFYLRRVTRLEPPYILSLLLFTAAFSLGRHVAIRQLFPHLAASLVYLHNLIYNEHSTISSVTWSLEVEIQFYLCVPLLAHIYRIEDTSRRRTLLFLLIGITACISMISGKRGHGTILGYGQYFFAGFLLADLLELPRHAIRTDWAWDVVSLIGWPLVFLPRGNRATEAWLPLLLMLVFIAAFHGRASNWFFRRPFVALTGGMCYSIYLVHLLIFQVTFPGLKHLQGFGDGTTAMLQMAGLIAVSLAGSAIFFLVIERPCMDPRWLRNLYERVRGAYSSPAR